MKPNFFTILMAALFAVGLNGKVKAVNPVVHITSKPTWIGVCKPNDKRPSVRDIENGYYFALVERQIDVDRQADYRRTIRQIESEAGIQNGSQIAIQFDPSYERLDFHEIVIWRDGKKQNRLNQSEFKLAAVEEDFSKFIYQGSYTANYIIPDVRKGDRIEYSYTITGRNPVFDGKFSQTVYLQWGTLIAHQYFSVQSASSRKLNIKAFNKVPEQVVTEAAGTKKYVWESFMVEPGDNEKNEPDWYNTYPQIQISEFNNWAEVATWGMKVNPVGGKVSGDLAKRVARLKAEAGTDPEKYFRLAVKVAQDEVRYMGIEIGEYSHRANRPENVFNQRYGDCKDKAMLLATMLRANGIEAYVVLVNTGLQDKITELLPTTGAFNHAVTLAYIKGKQVWIDGTISYQRGKGTDLYFPNYAKGLVLKANCTGLTDIPQTKTGKVISHEKYTVDNATAKVKLVVTTTYTLNYADDTRSELASSGLSTTEESYRKYYAGTYPKIEVSDSLTVKDDEEKNELTTVEHYLIPGFFKKDSVSGKYIANVYADIITNKLPKITDETKTPITLNYPYSVDHTMEVYLPGGWNVTDQNFAINRNEYSFNSDYSTSGNSLLLHYQFSFLKNFIPLDQLSRAKGDFDAMKDSKLAYSFSYNPNATAANAAGSGPLNDFMVYLVILVIAAAIGLGVWIYRIETPAIVFEQGSNFKPIGGWLIVVLIGLFLTPIGVLKTMADSDYFSQYSWDLYKGTSNSLLYHIVLVIECAGNVIIICTAIFCAVLLINRRDILPKVITFYFLFAVGLTLTDYVLALNLSNTASTAGQYSLFRAIVVAAIWVPYFRVSHRVHETLIVPYPSTNYSYEWAANNSLSPPADQQQIPH